MRAAALLLALALSGPAAAAAAAAEGRALDVAMAPAAVPPAAIAPGAEMSGAWVLTAGDPAFGGLSGIAIREGRVVMVSDRGHWLTGAIDPGAAPPLTGLRIAPIRGADGRALSGRAADAESLAWDGQGLHVAFEHAHRILTLDPEGRLGDPLLPGGVGRIGANAGMEALTTTPDGRLLALSEDRVDGAFLLWHGPPEGPLARDRLPVLSRHANTGAATGPDGTIYLLQRHFSPATGVSIRLLAYPPGPTGLPDPGGAGLVAAWETLSGIDNMEGVAAVPAEDGRLDLWIVSDDNFNAVQRTLLLRLSLDPARLQPLPPASIE